jgi:hypothetical protein
LLDALGRKIIHVKKNERQIIAEEVLDLKLNL